MKLTAIATTMCDKGWDCPAILEAASSAEDVFVQGYEVVDPAILGGLSLAPGEVLVRIPRSLLLAASTRKERSTE